MNANGQGDVGMKSACKDKVRCYPHGECPLKDKCLWRGVPHQDETCADVERFDDTYNCGVLNCGDGKCIHKLTNERCPYCGMRLVEVTTSGVKFCSNNESVCDYDRYKNDPVVKLCGNCVFGGRNICDRMMGSPNKPTPDFKNLGTFCGNNREHWHSAKEWGEAAWSSNNTVK